jgi:hypothetical protein
MIRFLSLVLITMLATGQPSAQVNEPESIRLANARISAGADSGWVLDADVQVRLSPVLIEAVQRGVPLVFVTEAEIYKNRWYWFDKKILAQSKTVRVMYHAVTQQYRVAIGGQHQWTFDTLEDALAAAVGLRSWPLNGIGDQSLAALIRDLARHPGDYESRMRVRLDSSQLPKPLQVNALTNRDWNLSSDWVQPRLVIEAAPQTP